MGASARLRKSGARVKKQGRGGQSIQGLGSGPVALSLPALPPPPTLTGSSRCARLSQRCQAYLGTTQEEGGVRFANIEWEGTEEPSL